MRPLLLNLAIAAAAVFAACEQPTSYPGDPCDEYVRCYGDFECIGFHCVALCEFEGDCDGTDRCNLGKCLRSCEAQSDCEGFGVCGELGGERRGKACQLTQLPQCSENFHCSEGLCVQGSCERWCGSDAYCSVGEKCNVINEYDGYCGPADEP